MKYKADVLFMRAVKLADAGSIASLYGDKETAERCWRLAARLRVLAVEDELTERENDCQ